ncbi:MAG: hypothetical protein ABSE51_19965 [Terracidiphilus sp.]
MINWLHWWIVFAVLAPMAALGQYVTLSGVLQSSNGLPAANYTISFTPSQFGFIAGTGVVVNTTTYCGTDSQGNVVGLVKPLQRSINTAIYSGGTLPAGNYFVVYSWYTSGGAETEASPESTAQLTTSGSLQIALPAGPLPAGALGMDVYIGTTSGGEQFAGQTVGTNVFLQNTALGAVTCGSGPLGASSEPEFFGRYIKSLSTRYKMAALADGDGGGMGQFNPSCTPPTNSTVCQEVANDAIWPVGTGYTVSLTSPSGNTQPGYPMIWQLLGPNTTINLSNGLPYYHGVVTFPVPILASPLNHAGQSISGSLSLGSYPMFAGSFGVGVVTPAWGVDVEGSGAKSHINANGGYLVNGSAGTTGNCLISDGTAYDLPGNCQISNPFYQTVLTGATAGSAVTQRSYLGVGTGTGLTAIDIVGVGGQVSRTELNVSAVGGTATTNTDTNVVMTNAGGVSGHCAQWDTTTGGIADSGGPCGSTGTADYWFTLTGCVVPSATPATCLQAVNFTSGGNTTPSFPAMPDTNYIPICSVMESTTATLTEFSVQVQTFGQTFNTTTFTVIEANTVIPTGSGTSILLACHVHHN